MILTSFNAKINLMLTNNFHDIFLIFAEKIPF